MAYWEMLRRFWDTPGVLVFDAETSRAKRIQMRLPWETTDHTNFKMGEEIWNL
jgi:hypothetical protein